VNWSGTYVFSRVLIYVHVRGALKLSPIVNTADGWWLPIVLKVPIKKVAPILKCGGKNTVRNSPNSAGDQIMAIMIGIRCGRLLNEAAPVYACNHEQNRSVVTILIYVSCEYWNGWIDRGN